YLQAQAPWHVRIPFIRELQRLAQSARTADPRILRDLARLRTLIKASAILHHRHRTISPDGRVEASLDDYRVVLDLYNATYAATAAGVSPRQREIVAHIKAHPRWSGAELARRFGISGPTMHDHLKVLETAGWITNEEWQRGKP